MVERIRGRALQRIRAKYFAAHPLCAMCEAVGRASIATDLDHIVALANGGTNDESNLQGLCASCHEVKTAADLGHKLRLTTGVDGWPVPDSAYNRVPRWRRAEGR